MAGRKIREESLGELKLERQELIQENKELVFENERIRRQNTMLTETLDAVANNEIIPDPNILFRLKTVLKNIEEMQ
jgi:regulator of replication initiation timing